MHEIVLRNITQKSFMGTFRLDVKYPTTQFQYNLSDMVQKCGLKLLNNVAHFGTFQYQQL